MSQYTHVRQASMVAREALVWIVQSINQSIGQYTHVRQASMVAREAPDRACVTLRPNQLNAPMESTDVMTCGKGGSHSK